MNIGCLHTIHYTFTVIRLMFSSQRRQIIEIKVKFVRSIAYPEECVSNVSNNYFNGV